MAENSNIWLNGVMGVVVGDALGCPVQFESRKCVAGHPVTSMRGYGTFNLPEGSWTDDSSLTLALLESIRRKKTIDLDDIMGNFMQWLYEGEFTPYGRAYDIGRGTMQAIDRYRKNGKAKKCGGDEEWNNGNGSLTHAHIRSNIACGLYFFMVHQILTGSGSLQDRLQEGVTEGHSFYEAYLADKENLHFYDRLKDLAVFSGIPADGIKSSGYVVDSLEAAVWSLITTDRFDAALLKAVNLGEDTDTVGAIAGGLGGLYYGYDAVPEEWLSAIKRREWIEDLCQVTL